MASDDIDSKFGDVRETHSAGSLDDVALLPGEFRAFRAEMRTTLELLTLQLLPLIKRANDEADDLKERMADAEARLAVLEDRPRLRAKR